MAMPKFIKNFSKKQESVASRIRAMSKEERAELLQRKRSGNYAPQTRKEYRETKELIKQENKKGVFLPNSAYSKGGNIRISDPTLDQKGSFMNPEAWERLNRSLREKDSVLGSPTTKSKRQQKQSSKPNRKKALNSIEATDSGIKAVGGLVTTTLNSGVNHFKKNGALKKAGIGTIQASAVSAAGHGGLAALQGEDPWEAAKRGAVRGALVGGGYQGLKGATAVNGNTIRENIGQIGSGLRDTYRAQTVKGQQALRKEGVSRQLETILRQKHSTKNAGGIFGLKQPKQPGGVR